MSTQGKDKANEVPRVEFTQGYCQWGIEGNKFIPAGVTIPKLPSGIYSLKWDRGTSRYVPQLDTLHLDDLMILPDLVTEKVLKDIRAFWSLQESYNKYNYVYKRGILLYGAPGCGKTSVIMLLAKELIENNGIVINININEELSGLIQILTDLREIESDRKVIVVFEDIDNFVREKSSYQTELLNILDGGLQCPNLVILATTNYPEMLEKRMSHRPSRFDRRYEVGLPSIKARRYYIKHKLNEEDLKGFDLNYLVKRTKGFTIDHLKELLLSVFVLKYDFEEAYTEVSSMLGKEVLRNTKDQTKSVGFNKDRAEDEEVEE